VVLSLLPFVPCASSWGSLLSPSENCDLDPDTLCLDCRFTHSHQLQCRLDFIRLAGSTALVCSLEGNIPLHPGCFMICTCERGLILASLTNGEVCMLPFYFWDCLIHFPSRFALKDGQLWLGHQQALMVSACMPLEQIVRLMCCLHAAHILWPNSVVLHINDTYPDRNRCVLYICRNSSRMLSPSCTHAAGIWLHFLTTLQ